MKTKIVTSILLLGSVIFGWFCTFGSMNSAEKEYKEKIKQADSWVEEKLYQRAILMYEEALEYKQDAKVWDKMLEAHLLRYKEAPDEFTNYEDALMKAMGLYPNKLEYVLALATAYCDIDYF